MGTVWESISYINTLEMGSPKDNKLQRVCCDSQRTVPRWSFSLMLHWHNFQHRDWMWGTGLLSYLGCSKQWGPRIIWENYRNVTMFVLFKQWRKSVGGKNRCFRSFILVLHDLFTFLFRRTRIEKLLQASWPHCWL